MSFYFSYLWLVAVILGSLPFCATTRASDPFEDDGDYFTLGASAHSDSEEHEDDPKPLSSPPHTEEIHTVTHASEPSEDDGDYVTIGASAHSDSEVEESEPQPLSSPPLKTEKIQDEFFTVYDYCLVLVQFGPLEISFNLSSVNKFFHQAIQNEAVWKYRFKAGTIGKSDEIGPFPFYRTYRGQPIYVPKGEGGKEAKIFMYGSLWRTSKSTF